MISKGYNEIRYMIEYRYGILSQLISEIDNYIKLLEGYDKKSLKSVLPRLLLYLVDRDKRDDSKKIIFQKLVLFRL